MVPKSPIGGIWKFYLDGKLVENRSNVLWVDNVNWQNGYEYLGDTPSDTITPISDVKGFRALLTHTAVLPEPNWTQAISLGDIVIDGAGNEWEYFTDYEWNNLLFLDNFYASHNISLHIEQRMFMDDVVVSTSYIGPTQCPNATDIFDIGACWCGTVPPTENNFSNVYTNGTCIDNIWTENPAITWQQTLEAEFDIVDTFDELQPWSGTNQGGRFFVNDHPDDFPIKLNGSPSIWEGYTQFYIGSSQIEDWIGSHGDMHWSGNQSMCINYASLYCQNSSLYFGADSERGYGTERMIAYLGNGSSSSGYNEVYSFYMQFLPEGFFRETNISGELAYGVLAKTFSMQRGFVDVKNLKCPDESLTDSSYGSDWYLDGYKIGSTVIANYHNYGTQTDINSCGYSNHPQVNQKIGFEIPYFAGEWFAVERRQKNNFAPGVADGESEIWLYNMNGTVIGHSLVAGVNNRPYRDTKFNRVEFGGNYQCLYNGINEYGGNPKFYVDDFIIDDERIGIKYFELLHNQTLTKIHNADTNSDGNISNSEMNIYVGTWKQNTVTISSLIEAFRLWKG